ncbi:MAG: hypothetical protein HZY76_00205 [Anaerolineae bacterium]|nr:MAG: hypothetical protein HZY76_00205 [Anaerolineae bacterium]
MVSREKPRGMARWEAQVPRASLHLKGIGVAAAQAILGEAGLTGGPADWDALTAHYTGNPLMLQLTAAPIRGSTAAGWPISWRRSASRSATSAICWMSTSVACRPASRMSWSGWRSSAPRCPWAIWRSASCPASPSARCGPPSALLRRHLVDRDAAGFFLQDIVLEHVTDRLAARLAAELAAGRVDLYRRVPLLNPTVAEHKRLSQERFIVAPLAASARQAWPTPATLAQRLADLTAAERPARPPATRPATA